MSDEPDHRALHHYAGLNWSSLFFDEGTRLSSDLGDGLRSTVWAMGVVTLNFTLHNDSDELIGPVRIRAVHRSRDFESAVGVYGRPVLPGTRQDLTVAVRQLAGLPDPLPSGFNLNEVLLGWLPVIEFRDSAGKWWRRYGFEPFEPLDEDPTAANPPSAP